MKKGLSFLVCLVLLTVAWAGWAVFTEYDPGPGTVGRLVPGLFEVGKTAEGAQTNEEASTDFDRFLRVEGWTGSFTVTERINHVMDFALHQPEAPYFVQYLRSSHTVTGQLIYDRKCKIGSSWGGESRAYASYSGNFIREWEVPGNQYHKNVTFRGSGEVGKKGGHLGISPDGTYVLQVALKNLEGTAQGYIRSQEGQSDLPPPSLETYTTYRLSTYATTDPRPSLPAEGLVLTGYATKEFPGIGKTVTISWSLRPTGATDLRADAGGPYEPSPGQEIKLKEGPFSQGDIVSWQWTFEPRGDDVEGIPFNAEAEKSGQSVPVVLLADTWITLEVEDEDGFTDSDRVLALVYPSWETPFSIVEEGRMVADDAKVSIFIDPDRPGEHDYKAGLEVSAPTGGNEVFYPHHGAGYWEGSWEGIGYGISQVDDPDGPFHGVYYVDDYRLRVERQALLNPYIVEEGIPPGEGYHTSWYEENVRRGLKTRADCWLWELRAHEKMHSTIIRDELEKSDPAPIIQMMISWCPEELKKKVDDFLRREWTRLQEASLELDRDASISEPRCFEDEVFQGVEFEDLYGSFYYPVLPGHPRHPEWVSN